MLVTLRNEESHNGFVCTIMGFLLRRNDDLKRGERSVSQWLVYAIMGFLLRRNDDKKNDSFNSPP